MIKEAVRYSFQFLEWRMASTLKRHWLVHTKKTCARDGNPLKKEYVGKTARRTFYCIKCQKLY
jgi:endonuclease-8